MKIRTTGVMTILAAALALSACEQVKSESALSNNLAGPIAGVEISSPQPVSPMPGARLRTGGPPVTLVVQNATTTGVRPLTYAWEVAANAEFSDIVFARAGVAAGDGQTSLQVPVPLGSGRAYFWRSRAEDGANVSNFSTARDFLVVDPPALQAPEPASPVGGARVGSLSPTLRVVNAGRSGDVQAVQYRFEVATSSSFGSVVAAGLADEQPGSTSYTLEVGLDFDRTYHWRARAEDPSTTGPWSNAGVFVTPVTPAAGGGGGSSGGGGGGGGPIPCSGAGSGVPSVAEGEALVACVKNALVARGVNLSGSCGAFEITTRVAWLLRDRGARLELYNGTSCNGHSHDIILFMPAGVSVDILVGAGGGNGPAWQVHHELIPGAPHVFPWNPDGGF